VDIASGAAVLTPPSAINRAIPAVLEDLILSMMALKTADRCPSMTAARRSSNCRHPRTSRSFWSMAEGAHGAPLSAKLHAVPVPHEFVPRKFPLRRS
jgi:hypothetical protein